jgi:ABC-2 type transport system permease protein
MREFIGTVSSRAFIAGLLLVPAIGAIGALASSRLLNTDDFKTQGEITIIDPDGRVTASLRTALAPARIAARRAAETETATARLPPRARPLATAAARSAIDRARGSIPDLRIVEAPPDEDLDRAQAWLLDAQRQPQHLAVIVVAADAVEPSSGGSVYGSYELYVAPNVDRRAIEAIRRSLREAIVDSRARARGLDGDEVEALMSVPRVAAVRVSAGRKPEMVGSLNLALPAIFGAMLFIGVLTGGQALLASTVEEKSSRVIEVVLSAVSPLQLMAGKILGQLAVSVVALGWYLAIGLVLLTAFALLGLLDYTLLLYLAIFFIITYLTLGSLMMAAGSVVNEMREAQTLLMPIMLLLMLPWLLWAPISQHPNSAFSLVVSFVPPMNTIAMLLRMASATPPPWWQVWLSIGVGVAAALGSIWFAAKVLRLGLLAHGKPPSMRTLMRWTRAA